MRTRLLLSSLLARLLPAFLIASGVGCGLNLRLVNSSVQKPSNVALYFAVEGSGGKPVAGLDAKQFRIYEDGQVVSIYESKQTILNPDVDVDHFIVLLLDLSASMTESGALPALIDAAKIFSERVTKGAQVAVYGFEGTTRLTPVVAFTRDAGALNAAISGLSSFKARDPSTNLHGAVVEATKHLKRQLASSTRPLRFGTLVVFTDGSDRTHRVTEKAMHEALNEAGVNRFAIGLGGEIDSGALSRLGRDGFVRATDKQRLKAAFDEVAGGIEAAGKKFYLLSYCSPARAGKHTLKVVAKSGIWQGSLSMPFDAAGFGPNCDPTRRPAFSLTQVKFK